MIFNTNSYILNDEEAAAINEYRAKKAEGAKLVVLTAQELEIIRVKRFQQEWHANYGSLLYPNAEGLKRERIKRQWEEEVQQILQKHGITRAQFQKIVGARI